MNVKNFNYWQKLYDSNDLAEFNTDSLGQLWLKTKSIIRKELILEFIETYSYNLGSSRLNEQFQELFALLKLNLKQSHNQLDSYFKQKNKQILADLNEKTLVSELYKLKTFEWGGDY